MSTYKQRYADAPLQIAGGSIVPEGFRDEYPTLAEVLGGVASSPADPQFVPQATITLFAEMGKLKFVIKPKSGDRVAFGTLSEPEKGLADVEKEISAGRFEWKRSSGRRSS